jgi:hypothetical protein
VQEVDPVAEHNQADFRPLFPGNGSEITAQISATIRRAPQHIINTDM